MNKYFTITVRYFEGHRQEFFETNGYYPSLNMSGHIIKSSSLKKALEIANKHEIGNPFHSKFVHKRNVKKVDMRYTHNKELIERRSQGIGGSIWFEDEKGNLQKEII